jgi:hypothetical protein
LYNDSRSAQLNKYFQYLYPDIVSSVYGIAQECERPFGKFMTKIGSLTLNHVEHHMAILLHYEAMPLTNVVL